MPSLRQSLDLAAKLRALVVLEVITKAQANEKFRKHSGINLFIEKRRKRERVRR